MRSRLPTNLVLIATLQFVAPLVLPPDLLASMTPALWGVVAFLFAALGFNLLRRRAWARLATTPYSGRVS